MYKYWVQITYLLLDVNRVLWRAKIFSRWAAKAALHTFFFLSSKETSMQATQMWTFFISFEYFIHFLFSIISLLCQFWLFVLFFVLLQDNKARFCYNAMCQPRGCTLNAQKKILPMSSHVNWPIHLWLQREFFLLLLLFTTDSINILPEIFTIFFNGQ